LSTLFLAYDTQRATADNTNDLYIIVYNGLGSLRGSTVQLPVSSNATYRVARLDAPVEQAQFLWSARSRQLPGHSTRGIDLHAKYVLSFDTGLLPPVGAAVFQISMVLDNGQRSNAHLGPSNMKTTNTVQSRVLKEAVGGEHVEVTNGQLAVRFDRYVSCVSAVLAILPWPCTHFGLYYFITCFKQVDRKDQTNYLMQYNTGCQSDMGILYII
jgi:hypothetical protein